MFASERQEAIVTIINHEGRVRVKELSDQFRVTEDCIRKDLAVLERQGLLKRAYGGAVLIRGNPHLYNSAQRKQMPDQERKIIAKKAMSLLQNDEMIYLDISVTSVELAELISKSNLQLTVITNMIDILNILCKCSKIKLIFIGGLLNQEGDGFLGTLSINQIKAFKIDKAFLGVVGVDVDLGSMSTYNIDDGMMKAAVIKQSQFNYVFCEGRKFEEDGNYIFAPLNDINGLITAKPLKNEVSMILENYGLIII